MKKTLTTMLVVSVALIASAPMVWGQQSSETPRPAFRLPETPSDPYFSMQELSIESQGKKIYGEMYTPKFGLNNKPVVIMAHGFNGTHINFYDIIPELAKDGFICYSFDFIGGSVRSRSEGTTEDMTIFTERQNLIDIVDYFREMKGVDKENIFLLGESQGGLEAAITAAAIPDKVKAIALMYPAFSIPSSTANIYPDGNIPEKMNVMGMPLSGDYYKSMVGYDLYKDIVKFKKDVLIVHGDADALVNKSVSDKASEVYDSCEYHVIAGGDHGFNAPANRAECRQYIRKFINDQLKTVEDQIPCLESEAHALVPMPDEFKQPAQHQGEVTRIDYQFKDAQGNVQNKYLKVYTPYGYDAADKKTRYNVFYLLHGGNGNPEHYWMWNNPSLKNILDNMIEQGLIDPVIVVTPTYYPPERTSGGVEDVEIFHTELVGTIMPLVESKYHTYAKNVKTKGLTESRAHRAFGGFSLGAACTWWQFIQSLEYFKYFLPMSGDCWALRSMGGPDLSEETGDFLVENLKKYPAKYADDWFLWSLTGDRDIAYAPSLNQMAAFQKHPELRFDDDFSKGNMYFSVMHGGFHSFEYINQYIWYALPHIFGK